MESPPSPNEQDILISRLVARISELEERLYRQELESPAVPQATAAPRSEPQRPRPESSLLAAFKDGWRSNSSSGGAAAPSPTDWFFSLARPQPPGQSQSQPHTQAQAQAGQPQQLQGRRLQYDPHPLSHPQQHLQQLQVGTPTGRQSSSGGLEAVDSHALSDASISPRNSSSPVHSLRMSIAGGQQGQEQGQDGRSGGGGGALAGPGEGVAGERSKASASSSSRTSVDGAMGERTGIGRGGERRGPSALTSSTEAQGDEQQQGEAGATAAAAAAATEAGSAQASDQGQGHAAPLTSSTSGGLDFEIMPSMKLNTPLIIHGRGAPQSQQPGPSTQSASGPVSKPFAPQDWLSSLFSSSKRSQQAPQHGGGGGAVAYARAFNEKSFQAQLEEQGREMEASAADGDVSGSYYRYVFDPVDVQAEMEVTSRVRKAAAEALMEAQEKLRAAEEVQAHLRQQLEDAMQLQQEVEQLKRDKEAALRTKKELEDQMIASTSKLEGMEQASQSLQDELEGLRQQRDIWRNASSNEQDKLKAENTLLRSQLQTRLNDLQLTKSKLGDAEADKQRLLRDLEDQATKLQWLQRINSQLESSAEQLEQYKKASAEFQQKFIRERNVRRKLHEQLQVLKGNIRVVCRVRPPLPGQGSIVGYPLEGLLSVSPPDRREHEFEFDHVFPPESTQEEVYEEVSSLVRSCADGYNVCIFAYGQTGSGKTFTMEGPAENPGIYVRALQELFAFAGEEGSAPAIGNGSSGGGGGSASNSPNGKGQVARQWQICVSMIEIYLDAVHDLLRPSSEVTKPLEVSALRAGEMPPGMDRVQGLTWRSVSNTQDVQQVLREGSKNRSTASTALNAHSSRSHAVLSVRLDFTSSDNQPCSSCIHLVDLAGSERVGKSEVTGQQLKEAQSINKSLSALGEVIAALQRRSPHVPFRNSKLTQVLQDSLCGSSKVLLVCNISPEPGSGAETLCSLNFASRAAQVELGQARKVTEKERPAQPASLQQQPAAAAAAKPPGREGLKPVRSSQSIGSGK